MEKEPENRRRLTILLPKQLYMELEQEAKAKNLKIQEHVKNILNGSTSLKLDNTHGSQKLLDLTPLNELRSMLKDLTSRPGKDWDRQSEAVMAAIKRRYRR